MKEGLGLGHPVQNDKFCVRCKSGEDHKIYKRWKQNLNTSDEQGEGLLINKCERWSLTPMAAGAIGHESE
jgi:hypothetical protein